MGEESYLLNRNGQLYLTLSEVLPPNPPPLGNNPNPTAIANRKEYFRKKDMQISHDKHSYRAIGTFLGCLSPEVYAQLQDIDRADHITAFAKWSTLWERFEKLYKPKGGGDAGQFRRLLQELTDDDGYLSFTAKFRGLVANMTAIPKLDQNGNPIPGQNYRPDDAELRSILLTKLGANGNSYFLNLRAKYLTNEALSWNDLIDEIVMLCNDPDKKIETIRRKTPVMKTAAVSVYTSKASASKRPLFCANCKKDHPTRACTDSYCYTCKKDFGSALGRQQHALAEHSRAARAAAGLSTHTAAVGRKRPQQFAADGGTQGKKARATPATPTPQPTGATV